jgi:hypothetical protein
MKKTILNIVYITNQNANNVIEKLFSQMNSPQDKHDDIVIYDIDHKRYIHISPMNFFIDPTTFGDMFDYDYRMRKQLQLSTFEPDKIYPFYDKSFVQLYFSIPLHMRYHYHKQLFSIDKI